MRSIALLRFLLLVAPLASVTAQTGQLVVRGLSFTGNKAVDDVTLSSAIATTNSPWLVRNPLTKWTGLGEERYFRERDLPADVMRIEVLYKFSGYFDVKVDTLVRRSDDDVKVTFAITEGEPIRVTDLQFEGLDAVEDRDKLLRDLPLVLNDAYSQYRIRETQDTLALRLRNQGYPTAIVDLSADADSATRVASVRFIATLGTRAVFGEVQVRGTESIDSAFVATLVPIRAGDEFQADALYLAQRALYASELFTVATVGIDTTVFAPGDSVTPIVIEVTEGPSHRARGSVGYATNDCFRLGAGWTARNFLGSGRVLDISTRVSKIGVGTPFDFGAVDNICRGLEADTVGSRLANFGVDVTMRRHAFLASQNTLSLTVFSERRSEYAVYLREDVGAQIAVTRETPRQIPITLSYRISHGKTQANQVSFCQFFNACVADDVAQLRERRVLTTLTLSAVRQRVNNELDPTRGSLITAEATVSSRFLGSSSLQQFVRLSGDATWYRPLSRSIVVAARIKGGVIFSPEIVLGSGEPLGFVPPDQRFYAGGPNDLRGYDRNELGPVVYVVPRDSLQSDSSYNATALRVAATGGDRLAIANVEVRFPAPFLSERFKLAAFVDAGALWSREKTAGLRITPGLGVRVASPLGPIRFDVGYNPYELEPGEVYTSNDAGDLVLIRESDRRERTRNFTIHFSIGHAF
jgi:outer membrane protein insertion porin family